MWFRIVAVAALGVALPAMAQSRIGPSVYVRANASPARMAEEARRDLESILQRRGDFETNWDIDVGLGTLYTIPVATPFAGLCRRDALKIEYVEVPSSAQYPPIRPTGMHTRSQFRVIRPRLGYDKLGPFDGDCPHIDGAGEKGWFYVDDEDPVIDDYFFAAEAYHILQSAAERLRAGTLAIGNCEDAREKPGVCKQRVLSVDADTLYGISACEHEPETRCFEYRSEDESVTVRVGLFNEPKDVESIEIDGINHII